MRWTTKLIRWKMQEDITIIANFKLKMEIKLRGNKMIQNLSNKPVAMVKKFELKTCLSLKKNSKNDIQRNLLKHNKRWMPQKWYKLIWL